VSSTASGVIDLSAYVDVGDRQAVSVESVDFVFQFQDVSVTDDWASDPQRFLGANGSLNIQVCDLNPNALLLRADSHSIVASGNLAIDDGNNIVSHESDIYPDVYGKIDESRLVVNDQLHVTAQNVGAAVGGGATDTLAMTVRLKCKIVSLNVKDWIAIAIQSTAADN